MSINIRTFSRYAILLTLVLFLGSSFPHVSGSQEKTLVLAGDMQFAPYSYVSDDKPAGYAVDLVKILSATINRNVRIDLMSWDQCITRLKNKNVDGLIGIPVYKQREPYADYTRPVAEIEFGIFVESANKYVNSVKSLEGTVVAVHKDSLIISELHKDRRIQIIETGSIIEALYKLKNREVTAVIAEKNAALYYLQQKNIKGLKIVGAPVGPVYQYALAISEGNTDLLNDVNRGIEQLKNNGTLEKLQRKWFGLQLVQPFPWQTFSMTLGGIMGILLLLMAFIWVVSLNATVSAKTRQIQLMSQKMVEKDKLAVLGKLAGQIAHELRTPLSIINNSVFLLRKEGSTNKELFEKRLRVLEDKIKLSSNILESILSYSRVKAEMATTVSMKECVEEVLKDVEVPVGVEISASIREEGNLRIFMDFHQLYSVIRNLVLNSIQAMGDDGKLAVEVFSSDNNMMVNVRVCDTGPGIPESARDKVFNLFYSTKITGTGLGLPISKSIIEANDGRLYLDTTSKEGTCFVVQLPSTKMLSR